MRKLKNRSQFMHAARGQKVGGQLFALQRNQSEQTEAGIGFTVTKREGNAVQRNRIKRRLRAAALACANGFQTQYDHVLIGRRKLLGADFDQICSALAKAQKKIEASKNAASARVDSGH